MGNTLAKSGNYWQLGQYIGNMLAVVTADESQTGNRWTIVKTDGQQMVNQYSTQAIVTVSKQQMGNPLSIRSINGEILAVSGQQMSSCYIYAVNKPSTWATNGKSV